jgi:hypothetical protein
MPHITTIFKIEIIGLEIVIKAGFCEDHIQTQSPSYLYRDRLLSPGSLFLCEYYLQQQIFTFPCIAHEMKLFDEIDRSERSDFTKQFFGNSKYFISYSKSI